MKSIVAEFGSYYNPLGEIYNTVNRFMAKLGFDIDSHGGRVPAEIIVKDLPEELEETVDNGCSCLIAVATEFGLTLTYGYEDSKDLAFWFMPFSNIISIKVMQ